MSVNEKMTAIANEIRNKTSLTDTLTLDQMVIDIASLPPISIGDVPSYVQSEAERVAETVKALQGENTLSFIAFSDVHVGSDTQSRNSALHASQGANIIKKFAPIDFSIVLGDIVTGAASDSLTTHLDNHMQAKRTLAMAEPIAILGGNHDANIYNSASYMSASDLYKYQGRHNIDVVKPTNETERNYFYFDIESKKTRVICINSADLKDRTADNPNDGHHISVAQYQWLVSVLDMTGKTDWKIIVLSHHPLHWYGYMPNVLTILNAYIAGASGSITSENTTISYNFSGKNPAKLVGTFHGHTHNLINGKVGDNEIIRMGTPNACYSRNNEYGSTSYGEDFRAKYGETTTYSKTANSAKDTAFVVNIIDFDNQTINSICYGAGYDRTLSYGAKVFYSITNNLTSVTTNNDIASVESGESYTATITVNDNCTLDSIVVTMGGVDITSIAVSGTTITIAEVTGNVVITATATKQATNWVYNGIDKTGAIYNGKGYKEGYRISTSSGNESSASGMTVTGFIPIHPNGENLSVIRIKDIDLTSGNSTWAFYDGTFAMVGGGYCNSTFGAEDANGVRSYTSTSNDRRYIRISGAFGTNPIITVDEEIE